MSRSLKYTYPLGLLILPFSWEQNATHGPTKDTWNRATQADFQIHCWETDAYCNVSQNFRVAGEQHYCGNNWLTHYFKNSFMSLGDARLEGVQWSLAQITRNPHIGNELKFDGCIYRCDCYKTSVIHRIYVHYFIM